MICEWWYFILHSYPCLIVQCWEFVIWCFVSIIFSCCFRKIFFRNNFEIQFEKAANDDIYYYTVIPVWLHSAENLWSDPAFSFFNLHFLCFRNVSFSFFSYFSAKHVLCLTRLLSVPRRCIIAMNQKINLISSNCQTNVQSSRIEPLYGAF